MSEECNHDFVHGAWSGPKCLLCHMRKEDCDRIEQLEGRLHDADLQGAKLEAALKAKTAEFDRLLRRDTDNLKRLIAAQATLQAIQELPRYAIETTFGGGWKAVPAEGYESTTFVDTDELEALLPENQHE